MNDLSASITIHCAQDKGRINPWIYGQFLEHIGHSTDLGLHAEMLTERGFHLERGGPAFMWRKMTDDPSFSCSLSMNNPYGGDKCLVMRVTEDTGEDQGVCQAFVPARKDEMLDGYAYLRSPIGSGQMTVGLRKRGSNEIYSSAVLMGLKPYWQKHRFTLIPCADDADAEFTIAAGKPGQYAIGSVSLMPLQNREGLPFREDLLQACKALRPTIIRWPGGCFASIYDWKDGIGPVEDRKAHLTYDWGDGGETDPYTFGTDEYIAFCRETGAEPLIVLNMTRGIHDALDWMEYCNGGPETEWGALRARNGHPDPHHVTCWSIDNELWHWMMDEDKYVETANEFIDSIRSRFPDVRLWIVGSGQPFEALDNPLTRATAGPRILSGMTGKVDYSSYHYYYASDYPDYSSLMASNLDLEALFHQEYEKFRETGQNTQIAMDEWNPGGLDFTSGLASALLLNSLERISDIVPMATPAVWIRNSRLSSDLWNNALINHDHRGWFPSVTYLAMKLWSGSRADHLLECVVTCGSIVCRRLRRENGMMMETMEPVPLLDVTASRDACRIVVKVVNRSQTNDIRCQVALEDLMAGSPVSAYADVLSSDDPEAVNSHENPVNIVVRRMDLQMSAHSAVFCFPRHSATVLNFMPDPR